MPTRTVDSAIRLLDRLKAEGYQSEIDESRLMYIIEEVIGADPRTTKSHLAFLVKHGFIRLKEGQHNIFIICYDKMYSMVL